MSDSLPGIRQDEVSGRSAPHVIVEFTARTVTLGLRRPKELPVNFLAGCLIVIHPPEATHIRTTIPFQFGFDEGASLSVLRAAIGWFGYANGDSLYFPYCKAIGGERRHNSSALTNDRVAEQAQRRRADTQDANSPDRETGDRESDADARRGAARCHAAEKHHSFTGARSGFQQIVLQRDTTFFRSGSSALSPRLASDSDNDPILIDVAEMQRGDVTCTWHKPGKQQQDLRPVAQPDQPNHVPGRDPAPTVADQIRRLRVYTLVPKQNRIANGVMKFNMKTQPDGRGTSVCRESRAPDGLGSPRQSNRSLMSKRLDDILDA